MSPSRASELVYRWVFRNFLFVAVCCAEMFSRIARAGWPRLRSLAAVAVGSGTREPWHQMFRTCCLDAEKRQEWICINHSDGNLPVLEDVRMRESSN